MNCPGSWSLQWIYVRQLHGAIARSQRNSPRESHSVASFQYLNAAHAHFIVQIQTGGAHFSPVIKKTLIMTTAQNKDLAD